MFCSKCGKMMDDNMLFCPYCGNKVPQSVLKGVGQTEQSAQTAVFIEPEPVEPVAEPEIVTPAEKTKIETPAEPVREIPVETETPAEAAVPEEPVPVQVEEPKPTTEKPTKAAEPAEPIAAPVAPEAPVGEPPKPKKKKTWLFILLAVIVIAGGVFAIKTIKEKKYQEALLNKYNDASFLLSEKKYDEAIKLFDELGDYKDSQSLSKYAMNQWTFDEAVSIFNGKNYQAAKDLFLTLEDNPDAEKYVELCDDYLTYEKIQDAYKNDQFSTALNLIKMIKNTSLFKDLTEIKKACTNEPSYRSAQLLLDQEEYYSAYNMFYLLGSYKDSADKAKECIQPEPKTGIISQNSKYKKSSAAQLKIELNKNFEYNVYFRVYTDDKTTEVSTIYLAPGKSATLNVPAGKYYVTYAYGKNWFGEKDLFGKNTIQSKYGNFNSDASYCKDGIYTVKTNQILTLELKPASKTN